LEKITDLAKRYAVAMESVKDVRSGITDAVIKYLLLNSATYEKCTQLAISEGLGLPLSTVRRLLMELEEDQVVKSREVGQAKPYSVAHLGYAMDRGYVSLDRAEIEEVLKPRELASEKDPGYVSLTIQYGAEGERDGEKVTRYLTSGSRLAAEVLVGRLLGYLPARPVDQAMRSAFTPKELNDMRLLFPEAGLFSTLAATGSLWPWSPTVVAFDKRSQASPQDVKKLVRETFKDKLLEALERLETLGRILEEDGYAGMATREPTFYYEHMLRGLEYPAEYRFRKEYIYATTFTIRQGLRIADTLGIDKELTKRIDELCRALDIAAELEYSGKKRDGPIEEWARKHRTP